MKDKKQSSDKKKSSRKKKNAGRRMSDDNNVDVMEDERFIAASTRPQFQKSGRTNKGGTLLIDNSNNNYGENEKIEIDDRFAAVLTDPRFQVGGDLKSDKYGRKIKKKGEKNNNNEIAESELTSFYKIKKSKDNANSDDDDDDLEGSKLPLLEETSDHDDDHDDDSSSSGSGSSSSSEGKEEKDDDDEDVNDPESRIAYLTALSRGEISASSSSDDDDTSEDDSSVDSSDSDESEDSIYGKAGILDPTNKATEEAQIDVTFESSPYLAVCNLDWKNVRAVDILAVLSSFTSPGSVKCVKVFPSDFGLEQLEREKVMGPVSIWKKDSSNHNFNNNSKQKSESDSDEEDDDIGQQSDESSQHDENDENDALSVSDEEKDILDQYKNFSREEHDENGETDFDPEKLRAYEASKLKYYFAVAEFANSESADIAYKEIDGMEIGHSSASFDLRSIPPTKLMEVVEGRTIRDEATNVPSNYCPPDFVVSALQQTAVKCTWDEGDAERQHALTQYGVGNQAWAAMTEGDDLKAYLASDVSSDESDGSVTNETKGSRLRAMLGLGSDNDNSENENDNHDDNSSQSDEDSIDGGTKEVAYFSGKSELVQKIRSKIESKKTGAEETKILSPWEKYQLKRKEKRKERRKEAKEKKNAFKQSKTDNESTESAMINEEDDDFLVGVKDKTKTPKKANKINSEEQCQQTSSEELSLLVSGTNGKLYILI